MQLMDQRGDAAQNVQNQNDIFDRSVGKCTVP